MNTKVTAGNAQISAASAKPFLQIADGEKTADPSDKDHFKTALSWEDDLSDLELVAPGKLEYSSNPAINQLDNWYIEVSTDAAVAVMNSDTNDGHTSVGAIEGVNKFTSHAAVKTLTLKNSSNITAEKLTVAFDLDGGAQAELAAKRIENSFRVLVVSSGSALRYVGFKASGEAINIATGLNGNNVLDVNGYSYVADGVLEDEMSQDELVHVNVYIYFDGNDDDAISANELLGQKILAGLSFNVTEPAAS